MVGTDRRTIRGAFDESAPPKYRHIPKNGAPGRGRTCNPLVRSQMRYPLRHGCDKGKEIVNCFQPTGKAYSHVCPGVGFFSKSRVGALRLFLYIPAFPNAKKEKDL